MTPLPKRRHSTRRGGKRHAALKVGIPTLINCKTCGQKIIPHRMCRYCGSYDGKTVVAPKVKSKKPKK